MSEEEYEYESGGDGEGDYEYESGGEDGGGDSEGGGDVGGGHDVGGDGDATDDGPRSGGGGGGASTALSDGAKTPRSHKGSAIGGSPNNTKLSPYRQLDSTEVGAVQRQLVASVADDMGVNESQAATLLRHAKWDADHLQRMYTQDMDSLFRKAGVALDGGAGSSAAAVGPLPTDDTDTKDGSGGSAPVMTCMVCFDEAPDTPATALALACGHKFCVTCWRDNLINVVRTGGAGGQSCLDTTCMWSGCKVPLHAHTQVDHHHHHHHHPTLSRPPRRPPSPPHAQHPHTISTDAPPSQAGRGRRHFHAAVRRRSCEHVPARAIAELRG